MISQSQQQQHRQLIIFFSLIIAILTSWSISVVHSTTPTTWVGYDQRSRQRHHITSAFINNNKNHQQHQKKNARKSIKGSTNIITTSLSNEEWETGIIDNILLSKSISDCIVQKERKRESEDSSSCVSTTTNTNNEQYQIKRERRRDSGAGRSNVLYNIRGGSSSYNGRDDDGNDYGKFLSFLCVSFFVMLREVYPSMLIIILCQTNKSYSLI